MSPDLQMLEEAMKRITAILNEADIAGSIVLTTPKIDGDPHEFRTIKHDHVSASFSYAANCKKFCCPEHGMVEGIVIEANIKPGDHEQKKKMEQTIGMFAALGKGVSKAAHQFEMVLKVINAKLSAAANTPIITPDELKTKMN